MGYKCHYCKTEDYEDFNTYDGSGDYCQVCSKCICSKCAWDDKDNRKMFNIANNYLCIDCKNSDDMSSCDKCYNVYHIKDTYNVIACSCKENFLCKKCYTESYTCDECIGKFKRKLKNLINEDSDLYKELLELVDSTFKTDVKNAITDEEWEDL